MSNKIKDKLIEKLKALGVEFSEVKYEDIKCGDMFIMIRAIIKDRPFHNGFIATGWRAMYRHLEEDDYKVAREEKYQTIMI